MPATYLTRAQVRDLDRRAIEEFAVPGIILMENAGRGAAQVLLDFRACGPIAICCGKGNNGGDGFVIARHLDNHGVSVRVLLFADPAQITGDARVHWTILERARIPIAYFPSDSLEESRLAPMLHEAEWVVDALFGTGLEGALRAPFDRVVTQINESGRPVLAVDIPSGLDCDSGEPMGPTVRADHTVTFVAPKKGFANPAARAWLGTVHVADIGAPRAVLLTPQ